MNCTLTLLHETYWILKGKRTVKESLKNCVTYLEYEGLPYCVSTISHLPVKRVSNDRPFTNVGIDFTGPLYICTHNSSNDTKAYICLFTFALTRVIQFQLTKMVTADSFLLTF